MTDYTRKEVAAISDAYRALEYLAECSSQANPQRIREAFSYEYRGRDSAHVAKLLMVREARSALLGERSGTVYTLAELFTLSPGLSTAYLFGAWCATQQGRLATLADRFIAAAEPAIAAHDAAQERGFAAFRGEG